MAKFAMKPTVSFEIHLTLDEQEARALEALTGYGVDEFLSHFYAHLGRAYMEEYEDGLRSLLWTAKNTLPSQLQKIDASRKALNA